MYGVWPSMWGMVLSSSEAIGLQVLEIQEDFKITINRTYVPLILLFLYNYLFFSLELVYGHTRADDVIYYFDAYMPAGTTKCGPQDLTGIMKSDPGLYHRHISSSSENMASA